MRTPLLLVTACLLSATLIHAQPPAPVQGPAAPEQPPTYEVDKTGKRAHIDFTLKVKPISDPNLQFSKYAGHKTFVFYFSAECPHCQHAFPFVQKVADALVAKGFTSVAIAIKNNSDESSHSFAQQFNAHLPIFQDDDRSFGEDYGTGYVPLLLLIDEKGEYVRYKSFDEDVTPQWIMKQATLMGKK